MAFSTLAPDLPMRMNTVLWIWGVHCDDWLTRLSTPALDRVSVRSLADLTGMRLTTILCQLIDAFAGFLSTVRYLTATNLPVGARLRLVLVRSESLLVCFLP